MKSKQVSPLQIFTLLYLSVMFSIQLRIYLPGNDYDPSNYMLASVFMVLLVILLCLPTVAVMKLNPRLLSPESDAPVLKRLFGVCYLFIAVVSLAHFVTFLHFTNYPNTMRLLLSLAIMAAVLFCILGGVQPLARIGGMSTVIFLVFFVTTCCLFANRAKISDLGPFMANGISDVARPIQQQMSNFLEISLLLWAFPKSNFSCKKHFPIFLAVALISSILTNFVVIVPLGVSATRYLFPFYNGLQISESMSFQHLDTMYLAVFTVLAVIRISLFLLAACEMLAPKKSLLKARPKIVLTAVTLLLGTLLSYWYNGFIALIGVINTAAVFLVSAVALPAAALIITLIKRKKAQKYQPAPD